MQYNVPEQSSVTPGQEPKNLTTLARKTPSIARKTYPTVICTPQILQRPAWDWTEAYNFNGENVWIY